ncbi:MAG: ABC transporter permease [Bacteroidota bacterium]
MKINAPKRALQFLRWFCREDYLEEIEGDLTEVFIKQFENSPRKAKWKFSWSVIKYFRPEFMKSFKNSSQPNSYGMYKSYFKIGWRNLLKNKGYSFINIGGLASGMAVAMLIGFWLYDELSFNKYHKNYDRIAQVLQQGVVNGEVFTSEYMPIPVGNELLSSFSEDFERVVMSSWTREHILASGDNKFTIKGNFLSPGAPEMLTLNMVKGTRTGLDDPSSVMLSESAAKILFGDVDPIHKAIRIGNNLDVVVTGVYKDLPHNTQFRDIKFMAAWDLYAASRNWVKNAENDWSNNSWQILAQISPQANFTDVSTKIHDIILKHRPEVAEIKLNVFLNPMNRWHLYANWDKAGKAGGRIEFVWLFGTIGVFVLLLACINFMNLSTARSEKRAKEVGIRKAIGSVRGQLMSQFFSESLLVVLFSFLLSIVLVQLSLSFFNELADKQIAILWANPFFWLLCITFSLLTGLIAGLYPSLYLSAFNPVKVLKGTFRAGRFASMPRKALVVVQFTVSIALIVGTIVIFNQIQYAKDRPIGYDRNGLITIAMNTPELYGRYNVLRDELLNTKGVVEMSASSTPATELNSQNNGFEWEGKDPDFKENFGTIAVTHDFGKTVGWQFVDGRDFSRDYASDSSGMVINETAVTYMNIKDPVGKIVKWNNKPYRILGVIKDMVMGSPYEPVYQTVFILDYDWANVINIKLNPAQGASESIAQVEKVFLKFNPGSPFDYKFSDQQFSLKFSSEERIGKLVTFFAVLAIFISCLGLFGLASFMAEQRTKEIGVRKVLGASLTNLWVMLSKDFVFLVIISLFITSPLAYYFMNNWIQKYTYHTEISWWIFFITGGSVLIVTLLTVSYQTLKAALINPVNSLKSE